MTKKIRKATQEPLDPTLAQMGSKRVKPSTTLGTGGTAIWGGYIYSNEKDSRLTGQNKYTTFSDLLANVSVVAAGVRYFLNLVSKASWKANPNRNGGAEAVKYAELVEDMLHDMETPWHRVVRRAAMHRFYGFSVQEWTAKKREDGYIGFLDVESRPQMTIEQWDVDTTGDVLGMIQRSPQTNMDIYIPRWKTLYMLDDALNDSPEGLGLFRHIVEPARRLQRFEQLEGFGFETDLRGMPVGRAPLVELRKMQKAGQLSAEERAAIEQPLRDFVTNHIKSPALGLLLDSSTYTTMDERATPSNVPLWNMDLLKAGTTSQEAVHVAISRIAVEIARILGTEHLQLGTDGKGSLALSRDKSHNFALIVDSTLQELKETVETDLVYRLFELNGWDTRYMPEMNIETVQWRDVDQITNSLEAMARSGAMLAPDDPAISEIRNLLGLSAPDTLSVQTEMALTGETPPTEEPNPEAEVPAAEAEENNEES